VKGQRRKTGAGGQGPDPGTLPGKCGEWQEMERKRKPSFPRRRGSSGTSWVLGDCFGPLERASQYSPFAWAVTGGNGNGRSGRLCLRLGVLLIGVVLALLAGAPLLFAAEWQTRRFGAFVFHYRPDDEKLVSYLGGFSREIEGRVAEDLGLEELDEIQVTIASTHDDFRSLQPPGRKAQNWAAALAYPSQDRILMKSPGLLLGGQPRYEQVFLHEVAHVALDQAARGGSREAGSDRKVTQSGAPASGIPRWLHEGYAIHVAREWSPNREVLLTRAVLGGRLIPLGRLVSDFPEDKDQAQLAYAQSADLVHYLIRSYGSEAFRDFVIDLGRGHRFGYASRTILGQDFLALEEDWHRHLRTRYTWIPLLTSTGSLWFLASLVFLAAYVRKKLTARAKVEEWSEEEIDPYN
jgi:hypothetical protein